jgi:hypothetical protein
LKVLQDFVFPSLRENAIFLAAGLVVALVVRTVYGWDFVSTIGLIMLIESAGLMLIGGAMELAASASGVRLAGVFRRGGEGPSKKDLEGAVERAGTFAFTGMLLFGETILLALALGLSL